VKTRNGDTIGELFEELFKRMRKLERSSKTTEEGQDDLLEGFAYVAAELARHQRNHEDGGEHHRPRSDLRLAP
jgi:hypothetical protein